MSARRRTQENNLSPIRTLPHTPTKMRRFELHRGADVSGISGTGIVAEGVEFTNGMCAITWNSPHRTVTFSESIKSVGAVHGHEGSTKIVWIDEEPV